MLLLSFKSLSIFHVKSRHWIYCFTDMVNNPPFLLFLIRFKIACLFFAMLALRALIKGAGVRFLFLFVFFFVPVFFSGVFSRKAMRVE